MGAERVICIFSISRDQTTTDVVRWLHHMGHSDVLRFNSDGDVGDDPVVQLTVDQDDLMFFYRNREVRLSDVGAVWYRKGSRWLCNQYAEFKFPKDPALAEHLRQKISREESRLSQYFHELLASSTPTIGSPSKYDVNKLLVLRAAKHVGLLVPPFRISNSKAALLETVRSHACITKAISDIIYLFEDTISNTGYYSYTEEVSSSTLSALPERLSPSLVQQQVIKRFDARVFYLHGECHGMAIFSQLDEHTRVDFRKYNYRKPNRTVPLRLPEGVQSKLTRLFEKLGMNTGSVDFVVDDQDRYWFLEINAVGQFSQVSSGCNYYLEKLVASSLEAHARG